MRPAGLEGGPFVGEALPSEVEKTRSCCHIHNTLFFLALHIIILKVRYSVYCELEAAPKSLQYSAPTVCLLTINFEDMPFT